MLLMVVDGLPRRGLSSCERRALQRRRFFPSSTNQALKPTKGNAVFVCHAASMVRSYSGPKIFKPINQYYYFRFPYKLLLLVLPPDFALYGTFSPNNETWIGTLRIVKLTNPQMMAIAFGEWRAVSGRCPLFHFLRRLYPT